MSDLDEALAALQGAVARLEAVAALRVEAADRDAEVGAIAVTIAARVDAAIARIDAVLAGEG